ncbi:hypothetical protein Klosneuvirus_1_256 [Klosneuvirus KNV1]|uniref:Uncharacterized protein n=1 Tax=Klosneuvirus KNV1 TaxID=1977640 RepID=A0A1V0SI55_9VIRU|nr:hypothetical protein Klosneuvirus_1_256 [Klosneuvirus KNV1]
MDDSKLVNVNLVDITDCDLYIDEESNEMIDEESNEMIDEESNEMIDENVLKNISWADSVEQELSTSMDTRIFMNDQKNEYTINIDNVISSKIECLPDINIMEYQTIIINNLRKEIKSTDDKISEQLDINTLLLKLTWLKETSKYLSDKLGLTIVLHNDNDPTTLSRSSYKFCDNNFECQYNYNIKKHYGCYARHYVHNLVNADIIALLNYIIGNKTNLSQIVVSEIRKSINTISFVIGHMYEELKNAQTFNFFNSKDNHIERNPKKKKNKKVLVQTS